MKNHLLECQKRDKFCNFCNLHIKCDEYSSHVYSCSSRTKQCPYCRKFIVLRDYEYHSEVIHDDGLNEGDKIFPGLNYRLDFSKKNPFYQEKIRKGFSAEQLLVKVSGEELKPHLYVEEDEFDLNGKEFEKEKEKMKKDESIKSLNCLVDKEEIKDEIEINLKNMNEISDIMIKNEKHNENFKELNCEMANLEIKIDNIKERKKEIDENLIEKKDITNENKELYFKKENYNDNFLELLGNKEEFKEKINEDLNIKEENTNIIIKNSENNNFSKEKNFKNNGFFYKKNAIKK